MVNELVTLRQPPVIADNIALDMINTIVKEEGAIVDYWASADDVYTWLAQVANITIPVIKKFDDDALFNEAVALRNLICTLVKQKKMSESIDIEVEQLNRFLSETSRHYSVQKNTDNVICVEKHYKKETPKQLLAPLAEAAAKLIAEVDFNLIKVCEHDDCILWFYDKTKAHRRRWCSMQLCGNRNKVANFRKNHR